MKDSSSPTLVRNTKKRLAVWALLVAIVLTIPLIAQFPWTLGDYIFGFVALYGSATLFEMATRAMHNPNHRFAVGLAVLAVLVFVWVGAATGFGTE